MPTKVWAVGEEVLAADFNAMVQRQVVATFPNAAARTAAIGAPTPGMASYLSDTGRLEVYTDKASPAGWYLPWGQPWGVVFNSGDVGQAMTPGPVVIAGTSFTFPAANRRYLALWRCNVTKDAAQGNPKISFQTNLAVGTFAQQTVSASWVASLSLNEGFASTGGVSSVFVIVEAGGGQVAVTGGRLIITDVGPV
jgi:hypothetical protein